MHLKIRTVNKLIMPIALSLVFVFCSTSTLMALDIPDWFENPTILYSEYGSDVLIGSAVSSDENTSLIKAICSLAAQRESSIQSILKEFEEGTSDYTKLSREHTLNRTSSIQLSNIKVIRKYKSSDGMFYTVVLFEQPRLPKLNRVVERMMDELMEELKEEYLNELNINSNNQLYKVENIESNEVNTDAKRSNIKATGIIEENSYLITQINKFSNVNQEHVEYTVSYAKNNIDISNFNFQVGDTIGYVYIRSLLEDYQSETMINGEVDFDYQGTVKTSESPPAWYYDPYRELRFGENIIIGTGQASLDVEHSVTLAEAAAQYDLVVELSCMAQDMLEEHYKKTGQSLSNNPNIVTSAMSSQLKNSKIIRRQISKDGKTAYVAVIVDKVEALKEITDIIKKQIEN